MNRQRFETLAEAFGGDVARWPEAEREAAAERMAAEPDWARGVLAEAANLDLALDTWEAPRGSIGLASRIAAGAPAGRRRRWAGWLLPAGMGAGLAAACAAGVVAGAALAQSLPAGSDADALVAAYDDDDVSLFIDEAA